jgi:hypothetical protein
VRRDAHGIVPKASDALSRLAVLAGRPRSKAVEAFESKPGIPFVAALEPQDLALCAFGAAARLVAELRGITEAVDRRGTGDADAEVAG